MTKGIRRTEWGIEFTSQALGTVAALLTIVSLAGGLVVGLTAWKSNTEHALATKVDERRFLADSTRLAEHIREENKHYETLLEALNRTGERVSDIWCESHFPKGKPPRSCQ